MNTYNPLELKHYLVFEVAGEMFAFDVLDIDSIHSSNRKRGLDNMEDIRTAVRLYKKLVPIIDLGKVMGLQPAQKSMQPSLIFIKNRNKFPDDIVGIQIDKTIDIIETSIPKREDNRPHRLVKVMIGQKSEIVHVLRAKDVVLPQEHKPNLIEVLN